MLEFSKRHKMLTLLFWICMWLLVKNSDIPYVFNPPRIVSLLFDAPQNDFFNSMTPLVDIFTSAYVTSLIFYIFIEYLPTLKKEEEAKVILKPKLTSLYFYMSQLLARIEFSAKVEGIIFDDEIKQLDKLPIKNKTVYCKVQVIKNDVIQGGETPIDYNLLRDGNLYKDAILTISQDIAATPSLSYCDFEIINLISEIQLADFWTIFPKLDSFLVKFDNVSYEGLGEAYIQVKEMHMALGNFIDTRQNCVMKSISQDEIDQWEKTKMDSIIEYPLITDILVEIQKQDSADKK